ncbi:hypothetical protein NJBCHELONAE_01820 [Mycobacteroides chelonae]|nr:hypothetical protein NJBCHELONAE_01820 [Mycobacteroides chelonae]
MLWDWNVDSRVRHARAYADHHDHRDHRDHNNVTDSRSRDLGARGDTAMDAAGFHGR